MIVLSLPSEVDTADLSKMETYFEYLFYWVLVDPSITLVWLIRKRKLCWMSERQANENENDAEIGPRITEESRELQKLRFLINAQKKQMKLITVTEMMSKLFLLLLSKLATQDNSTAQDL